MRYIYPVITLATLLLTGCIKRSNVEFTGTAPGVKNGVFIIKTTGDSTIYGENIKDGKFTIPPKQLKYPGYYLLNITDNDNTEANEPFEVYLEDGKYIIETEQGKLYKYPKIISPSKIQEQLSAFYTLSDKLSVDTKKEVEQLNDEIKIKGNSLSRLAYNQLINKLGVAETGMTNNNINAFKQFLKQYPNSEISAHLMSKLNYEDDPVSYYAIYKTLTPAARNSDDGKEIGDKLSHMVKLVPGVIAPAIYGKTPGGKPFDPKSINKKVILIDFWRAGNDFSRRNHQELLDLIGDTAIEKKVAIVSVSLDTKADWWITAINEDHMTWTQVSDLKGDDSPNAANWSISTIPTYYLLDNNWKIVESNIDIGHIDKTVSDYFALHP
jgi:hypothetical protein